MRHSDDNDEENVELNKIATNNKKMMNLQSKMDNYKYGFENIGTGTSTTTAGNTKKKRKKPATHSNNGNNGDRKRKRKLNNKNSDSLSAVVVNPKRSKGDSNSSNSIDQDAQHMNTDSEPIAIDTAFWTHKKFSKTQYIKVYFDIVSSMQ